MTERKPGGRGRRIYRNEHAIDNPPIDLRTGEPKVRPPKRIKRPKRTFTDVLTPPEAIVYGPTGRVKTGGRAGRPRMAMSLSMIEDEKRVRNLLLNEERLRAKYLILLENLVMTQDLIDLGGDRVLYPVGTIITSAILDKIPTDLFKHIAVGEPMDTMVDEKTAKYWRTRKRLLR